MNSIDFFITLRNFNLTSFFFNELSSNNYAFNNYRVIIRVPVKVNKVTLYYSLFYENSYAAIKQKDTEIAYLKQIISLKDHRISNVIWENISLRNKLNRLSEANGYLQNIAEIRSDISKVKTTI